MHNNYENASISMYMYVHVHVYMCTLYTHLHVYMQLQVHVYTYMYMYIAVAAYNVLRLALVPADTGWGGAVRASGERVNVTANPQIKSSVLTKNQTL